jgi:hypothetical protein
VKPARREIPIVLATSALLYFTSASRAAALALPELAFAAFFVGGVLRDSSGRAAPWFVALATLVGIVIRRFDLESWALFIPGGLSGRVNRAYGPRAATAATGVILIERLLLAALASVLFGHYVAALAFAAPGSERLRNATTADVSAFVGILLLGWLWLRARRGHLLTSAERARHVWLATGVLLLLLVAALITAITRSAWPGWPTLPDAGGSDLRATIRDTAWMAIAAFAALGRAAPAIGVADSIPRVAHELAPPRIAGLRRAVAITSAATLLLTAALGFVAFALTPPAAGTAWTNAPLAALAQALGPPWIRWLMTVAVVAAAGLLLGQTARAGIWGAESTLVRLA